MVLTHSKKINIAIGSLVSVGVVMCVSVKKLRAQHQKVGLDCKCMLKRTYFKAKNVCIYLFISSLHYRALKNHDI